MPFSMAKTVTGIVTFSDGEIFLGKEAKTINGLFTGVAFLRCHKRSCWRRRQRPSCVRNRHILAIGFYAISTRLSPA
jgi:hypothetical protein